MQQWARLILIAMEAVWSILPISFSELSSSYLCDGYWWLAPPVCSYRSDPFKFDRHEVVLIVTRTRLIIEFKSWDIEVMSKVNLTEKKKMVLPKTLIVLEFVKLLWTTIILLQLISKAEGAISGF